ncbi:MAG: DUF1292 domain-containing protein [Clostridia bacterium]|nr:DUF1292 domain-containing protein [Clostridia bacterium]
MKDNMEKEFKNPFQENDIIVLTDEETGADEEFVYRTDAVVDGQIYFALTPAKNEELQYVILKVTVEGEELSFESVIDDEEFDKVADYFNDVLFDEIDYDAE